MGIRVKGATTISGRAPVERIIEDAIGMDDPYGRPFELIHLIWTPYKKCASGARTGGFEEAYLLYDTVNGIRITYRDGSAEWIKGLRGRLESVIPRTQKNLEVLAANYYDKLWKIKEPHIERIVKKMADEIEEKLEKKAKKSIGAKQHLDFEKKRREGHFMGKMGDIRRPVGKSIEDDLLKEERALIEKRRIKIEAAEAELEEKKKKLGLEFSDDSRMPEFTGYTEPELERYTNKELRKLGIEMEFDTDDLLGKTKKELIEKILNKQNEPEKVTN